MNPWLTYIIVSIVLLIIWTGLLICFYNREKRNGVYIRVYHWSNHDVYSASDDSLQSNEGRMK